MLYICPSPVGRTSSRERTRNELTNLSSESFAATLLLFSSSTVKTVLNSHAVLFLPLFPQKNKTKIHRVRNFMQCANELFSKFYREISYFFQTESVSPN